MRGRGVLFTGIILLAACGGTTAGATGTLLESPAAPPTARWYDGCGFKTAAREVIRSDADWRIAWAKLFACRGPAPELPVLDFSREMVLVAALGQRNTGGFAVRIDGATVSDGVLRVQVVETRPGPGCVTTQALTYPVAIARVPRHDREVQFVERVDVADCR
jgi:PrcB C-terminal